MGLIGNLKGSAGNQGPSGPPGPTGTPGANGTTWFTNTVSPQHPADDGIGANNDLWLNTVTGDLFKKVAGQWV
jgi:hypothetical protein